MIEIIFNDVKVINLNFYFSFVRVYKNKMKLDYMFLFTQVINKLQFFFFFFLLHRKITVLERLCKC
jgi:hypothetical protein